MLRRLPVYMFFVYRDDALIPCVIYCTFYRLNLRSHVEWLYGSAAYPRFVVGELLKIIFKYFCYIYSDASLSNDLIIRLEDFLSPSSSVISYIEKTHETTARGDAPYAAFSISISKSFGSYSIVSWETLLNQECLSAYFIRRRSLEGLARYRRKKASPDDEWRCAYVLVASNAVDSIYSGFLSYINSMLTYYE